VLVGGAERTTQLFGRRIDRRYQGKLQTVLDRRDAGHPVRRWYYATSFTKNYVRGDRRGDRILRAENLLQRRLPLWRRPATGNLPLLRQKLAATNARTLALQADLQTSPVDGGLLADLTRPTMFGHRRVPGSGFTTTRSSACCTSLHLAAFAGEWTTRELHTRVLARHRHTDHDYRLSQLRYDLAKLRAKGPVHRVGRTRRYHLTPQGAKLVLLVKLRTCLLGPLATLANRPTHPTWHFTPTPTIQRFARSTPLLTTCALRSA